MTAVPADLLMMLLGDARFPVAGHTQSAGLEAAVQQGLTGAEVPLYVAARLSSTVRIEAGAAVVALHHSRHYLSLEPVARAWAARTPSPALRRTSRTQGRALLRVASRLWPDSSAIDQVSELAGAPRAVVLGAVAATLELTAAELARLVGYDDVQTVASAALKLLPLDPAVAAGWVHDALPQIALLADDVSLLTAPRHIPATSAPQIELWAEVHARSNRRLFSA